MERTFLIYQTGFRPTNGTSVYVRRLLRGLEEQVVHILWNVGEAGRHSVANQIVADDQLLWWPTWLRRGRSACLRLRSRLGMNWWNAGRLNRRRFARQLAKMGKPRPQRAWIICMREADAAKIRQIWSALGKPPYLLHVMDIFHDHLSEEETPEFSALVRGAERVICISENIKREVDRMGAMSSHLLLPCTEYQSQARGCCGQPLRLVLSGALYTGPFGESEALRLLKAAWPHIETTVPGIEVHYAGVCGAELADYLPGKVKDHGLLDPSVGREYECLLRSSHLAFLPVSHLSSSVGRYSLPSRITDYMACGLPVVVCTDSTSGIAEFLRMLPEGCTWNVRTVESLIALIKTLNEDRKKLAAASELAASFAHTKLSLRSVREKLMIHLDSVQSQ